MNTKKIAAAALVAAVACVAAIAPAAGQGIDYGKPGDPIHLVVGYQPYYTQSWSGVVLRTRKFYEKYLPKGSKVEFQVGLQGALIVNNMLAGKQHIGYMGDMPAIVATTKPEVADIRLVAAIGVGQDMCNIVLARKDAPDAPNSTAAIKWLAGKQVATPKGTCSDRFAQTMFKSQNVQPKDYFNQNADAIATSLREGKLDATIVWEPIASRLVEDGLAKRIASGATVDDSDAALLAMRGDLIKARPDVVKAWLNAELDAELYLADPKNADEITRSLAELTAGFTQRALWKSLYGQHGAGEGGVKTRLSLTFGFTPRVLAQIRKDTEFLFSINSVGSPTLRPEAIAPEFAEQVLKERRLKAPVGAVSTLPDAQAPR